MARQRVLRPPARTGGMVAARVVGLADFQADLKRVSAELPRELRKANLDAAKVVQSVAWRRAISLGGVAAKVAPSLRATAEQRRSKISLGGARYPMALGANFGAYHDKLRAGGNRRRTGPMHGAYHGYNQFVEWGGNQWTGGARDQFLYWAIFRTHDEFIATYRRLLDDLERRAFPD